MALEAGEAEPGVESHRGVIDRIDHEYLEANLPVGLSDPVQGVDQQLLPDAAASPVEVDGQSRQQHGRHRIGVPCNPKADRRFIWSRR